jgi:hypothetical protein
VVENGKRAKSGRGLTIVLSLLIATGLVIGGVVTYHTFARDAGEGIVAGFKATGEYGALQARDAAQLAKSKGEQYGRVTVAQLQNRFPSRRWVAGSTISSSAANPNVSVTTADDHIITAVQPVNGLCSYGLAIESMTDPTIDVDGIHRPGVYSTSVMTNDCSADTAPRENWTFYTDLN